MQQQEIQRLVARIRARIFRFDNLKLPYSITLPYTLFDIYRTA